PAHVRQGRRRVGAERRFRSALRAACGGALGPRAPRAPREEGVPGRLRAAFAREGLGDGAAADFAAGRVPLRLLWVDRAAPIGQASDAAWARRDGGRWAARSV